MTQALTLYTFAMSHYSEKVRWTLDCSGIPNREVCMSPAFHILPALRMGRRGQTTLPILQSTQEAIQDSPRILAWLQTHRGPLAVMPPEQTQALRDVTQRFDAIGKDVARYLYAHSFGTSDAEIIRLWTDHASPWQATLIRSTYPVMRWVFKQKLHINPARVKLAEERIRLAVEWLERELSVGHVHLVGDRFSVADITAASLLAPLACPSQHPVYGDPSYQAGMAQALSAWRDRPAMAWVRHIYDKHRGSMLGGVF